MLMLQRYLALTVLLGFLRLVEVSFADSVSASIPSASPTDPLLEKTIIDIYDTTMSPYCPGRTLSACPSEPARELRNEVRTWIIGGISKDEVMQRLDAQFGDQVSGIPSSRGLGIFSWLMPIAFVTLGIIMIWRVLRRMPESAPKNAKQMIETRDFQTMMIEALDKQIEEEVKKRMSKG